MKCVERIRELAAKVGAAIDEESLRSGTLIVDAPVGYTWDATGCTTITCAAENNGCQSWWTQACKEIEADMRHGLSLCSPSEIEEIEYARDEPWHAPEGAPERLEI